MPRGYRKKGQFALKVWYPSGASFSIDSTRDLPRDEWVKAMREYLTMFNDIVDQVAAKKED